MPTRSQFLVLTGYLALGMILGSLATFSVVPTVPETELVKPTPKDEGQKPKVALPLISPVAEPPPAVAMPVPVAIPAEIPPAQNLKPGVVVPVAVKVALLAEKPNPDDVLRKRGLKRSNLVYILEAEDQLFDRINNLRHLQSLGNARRPDVS